MSNRMQSYRWSKRHPGGCRPQQKWRVLAYVNDGDRAQDYCRKASVLCVFCNTGTIPQYHMIHLEGKDAECSTRNDLGQSEAREISKRSPRHWKDVVDSPVFEFQPYEVRDRNLLRTAASLYGRLVGERRGQCFRGKPCQKYMPHRE